MASRREFLTTFFGVGAGIAVQEATFPLRRDLNRAVQEATGLNAGNASLRAHIESQCKDASDAGNCVSRYEFTPQEQLSITITNPVLEEIAFRAIPSHYLSVAEGVEEGKALQQAFVGNFSEVGATITRRELIVGAVSSLVFALMHNFTEKGLDTKTIPASQFTSGATLWYFQRKFGLAASIVSHMYNNARAIFGK